MDEQLFEAILGRPDTPPRDPPNLEEAHKLLELIANEYWKYDVKAGKDPRWASKYLEKIGDLLEEWDYEL
jgi:hypothetical protein